jgi:hypothetical protein
MDLHLLFPSPVLHFSESCLYRCLAVPFCSRPPPPLSTPFSLISLSFFTTPTLLPPRSLPDSEAMRRSGMAEDVAEKIFEDFSQARACFCVRMCAHTEKIVEIFSQALIDIRERVRA